MASQKKDAPKDIPGSTPTNTSFDSETYKAIPKYYSPLIVWVKNNVSGKEVPLQTLYFACMNQGYSREQTARAIEEHRVMGKITFFLR